MTKLWPFEANGPRSRDRESSLGRAEEQKNAAPGIPNAWDAKTLGWTGRFSLAGAENLPMALGYRLYAQHRSDLRDACSQTQIWVASINSLGREKKDTCMHCSGDRNGAGQCHPINGL